MCNPAPHIEVAPKVYCEECGHWFAGVFVRCPFCPAGPSVFVDTPFGRERKIILCAEKNANNDCPDFTPRVEKPIPIPSGGMSRPKDWCDRVWDALFGGPMMDDTLQVALDRERCLVWITRRLSRTCPFAYEGRCRKFRKKLLPSDIPRHRGFYARSLKCKAVFRIEMAKSLAYPPRCRMDASLACVPIGGDPICIHCRAKKEAETP